MPNFMLVSLNARFLLKIDLICLAMQNGFLHIDILIVIVFPLVLALVP